MRSRSRWNGVRRRHSSSGASRPRVSYERTASGESHCSSCSRTASAKPSATCPAISGIVGQRIPLVGGREVTRPSILAPMRLRRRTADQPVVVCGSGSRRLGGAICEELGVQPASAETMRFAEGTIFVRLLENVRGRDVYVVQSTVYPTNDNVVELLFWLDACRRASAASVTAVVPYFSYGKGDKKDEPRVSIRARVCADAIEAAGADRVFTLDLHAPQIQGFFRIPVDDLYALPVLSQAVRAKHLQDLVVVSPDAGFAKTALVVDDVTISAGTLCAVAEALMARGALGVHAAVSHGVFAGEAMEQIQRSPILSLLVTDSVESQPQPLGSKIEVVPVAPLLGEAIKRIHNRESISVLFE